MTHSTPQPQLSPKRLNKRLPKMKRVTMAKANKIPTARMKAWRWLENNRQLGEDVPMYNDEYAMMNMTFSDGARGKGIPRIPIFSFSCNVGMERERGVITGQTAPSLHPVYDSLFTLGFGVYYRLLFRFSSFWFLFFWMKTRLYRNWKNKRGMEVFCMKISHSQPTKGWSVWQKQVNGMDGPRPGMGSHS